MKPQLFTTATCSKCPAMKKFLAMKGVEYEIVDCTDDVNLIKPASDLSGVFTVPQFKVGDKVVVGLDYGKAAALLV